MSELLTMQDLANGRLDVKALGEAANGDENTIVTTRTGETYPSAKKAINTMFEAGGLPATPFSTKVLMTASALVDGKYAMVTDDTVNNGLYRKAAGAWVKSDYDPIKQAKSYADVNKLDFSDITYSYEGGNMTKRSSLNISEGYGINSSSNIVKSSSFDLSSIQVHEGDVLYVHNNKESYASTGGGIFKFFSGALNLENLPSNIIIPDDRITFQDTDGKNYRKVTVPVGSSTLAFNTKFNDIIEWAVTKNEPLPYTAEAGIKRVVELGDTPLSDPDFINYLESIESSVSNYGDLYNITETKAGYINTAGSVLVTGSSTWEYFATHINAGSRYYVRVERTLGYPFVVYYSKSNTMVDLPFETAILSKAKLNATPKENIYYFDVPEGAGIVSLFMNVKVDTGVYANPPQKLDITESLSIQEGGFKEDVVGVPILNLSSLNGYNLVDATARRELAKISSSEDTSINSRFKNKRVMAIGDSITQGTMGGYVKYIESAMGTEITNIAMSGSSASRMVDKLLAGSGLPKRDTATSGSVWDELDKTELSCAFIMLGTNDVGGAAVEGVDILPTDTLSTYPDINDYWQLFPNTYMGNMALIVEIIKYYSPQSEIFIVSPPHKYFSSGSQSISTKINPMLQVLCKYYSLDLIDGTHESGLSYKLYNGDLNIYSYDGIHLNEMGNKLFGEFVARKIL